MSRPERADIVDSRAASIDGAPPRRDGGLGRRRHRDPRRAGRPRREAGGRGRTALALARRKPPAPGRRPADARALPRRPMPVRRGQPGRARAIARPRAGAGRRGRGRLGGGRRGRGGRGARIVHDPRGEEARRFGVATSGHALLFDRGGRARLRRRDHRGPRSRGRQPRAEAILARLGGLPAPAGAPVFGCPIEEAPR